MSRRKKADLWKTGGGRMTTCVVLTRAHKVAVDLLVAWFRKRTEEPVDCSTTFRVALELLCTQVWPGLDWEEWERTYEAGGPRGDGFACFRCGCPCMGTTGLCLACGTGKVQRRRLKLDPVAALEGRRVPDRGCRTVPDVQEPPARRQAPAGPPSPAEDYPALGSAGVPSPAEDYPALGSAGVPSPAEDYPALGSAVGPVASDQGRAPSPQPKAAKPKRARKPGKPRKGR